MSKGSRYRPVNYSQYSANYDLIFRKVTPQVWIAHKTGSTQFAIIDKYVYESGVAVFGPYKNRDLAEIVLLELKNKV